MAEIETDRLQLRKLTGQDLDDLAQIYALNRDQWKGSNNASVF
jgi:hypothetical protein